MSTTQQPANPEPSPARIDLIGATNMRRARDAIRSAEYRGDVAEVAWWSARLARLLAEHDARKVQT